MTTWYGVLEQTHDDMGWLHPVRRMRTLTRFNLPGNIKKQGTAFKRATESKTKTVTCRELWDINKKQKSKGLPKIVDQEPEYPGFTGSPSFNDTTCREYHKPHIIGSPAPVQLQRGWRLLLVTLNPDEVGRLLASQAEVRSTRMEVRV